MKKYIFLFFVLLTTGVETADAQNFAEGRIANSYRYIDYVYTFRNHLTMEGTYIGTPGSDEFNLGVGYTWQPSSGITLTPTVSVTLGKENAQRGIKASILLGASKNRWKFNGYLAYNFTLKGVAPNYLVLDTLDVTHEIGKGWEIGASSGLFLPSKDWGFLTGPMIKRGDHLGSWAVSYRFGTQQEFRIGRTFTF